MTYQEACDILGVKRHAGIDEIKSAYLRLMKHFHPDRGGAAYVAVKINQARDTLIKKK